MSSVAGNSPGPLPSPIISVPDKIIISERAAVRSDVPGNMHRSVRELERLSDVRSRRPEDSRRRHRREDYTESDSDLSVIHSRRKKHSQRNPTQTVQVIVTEQKSEPKKEEDQDKRCGRCRKLTFDDPLDPRIKNLTGKRREKLRNDLIRRIQNLKKKYPKEDIRLPSEPSINDPVVCYKRYVRIVRHLYGKRKVPQYKLMLFVFIFVMQLCLSMMLGSVAADYLKKEYSEIGKYDSIFYEIGCRNYSPHVEPTSPEVRFAWQIFTPIILLAITFICVRFTPIPSMAVGWLTQIAAACMKGTDDNECKSLLNEDYHDEQLSETESSDSEHSEKEDTPVPQKSRRKSSRADEGPKISIPDLEAHLPDSDNTVAVAIKAAVPTIADMLTSLRAKPEGSAPSSPEGLVGAVMGLAGTVLGSINKSSKEKSAYED